MSYRIVIKKNAEKFIRKQPKPQQERIFKAIYALPEAGDIKALKGNPNLLRLRVGDYRIIYTVDHGELVVIVIDIGPRGQIYNNY